MSLKEILIAEEIDKVFVSSIPEDEGNRLFVYFNQLYPELEPDETIEYEGDIESIVTNSTKIFVEKHNTYNVECTLEGLIIKAIHEEDKQEKGGYGFGQLISCLEEFTFK